MPKMRPKKLNLTDIEVDTKNPTIVKKQQAQRKKERKKRNTLKVVRNVVIVTIISLLVAAIGLYIYFYSTAYFTVENVEINGVKHLTDDEMSQLTDIPEDTDLLKVDVDIIKRRLKSDA